MQVESSSQFINNDLLKVVKDLQSKLEHAEITYREEILEACAKFDAWDHFNICPNCEGTGEVEGRQFEDEYETVTCPRCGGGRKFHSI